MNNILTDTAMSVIIDLWSQTTDRVLEGSLSNPSAVAQWQSIANACTAYAVQHGAAQMLDESAAFDWLGDIAIVHAEDAANASAVLKPKIAIVRTMDEALK